ncbi:Hypothetical protein PMT_2914 [Prochlorococcus marinus str. MIT 9313]|uniref:Uncharacterized protein n=1 Tax=Prochlorococcus marinus (strain MIT 9313) TaxID=74547 RepID=B9ESS8_PROMM|nr:Hypothetical protein PMT_2914 [Prochlorococcus marinus str. MIT 9313]
MGGVRSVITAHLQNSERFPRLANPPQSPTFRQEPRQLLQKGTMAQQQTASILNIWREKVGNMKTLPGGAALSK